MHSLDIFFLYNLSSYIFSEKTWSLKFFRNVLKAAPRAMF